VSSRSVRIIAICEDTQHEVFVRRFLKLSSVNRHDVRVRKCPRGSQDAKQWIREVLPGELASFRSYKALNPRSAGIVCVMTDADNRTVRERINDVSAGCTPTPAANEDVCFIVPRWAVETWLKYLRGEDFDEDASIQRRDRYRNARDCWPQVDSLKAMCDSGTLRQPAPSSLDDACVEFQRVRSAFRQ
jgi:hypothetical protein